jgi:hypothetical protein
MHVRKHCRTVNNAHAVEVVSVHYDLPQYEVCHSSVAQHVCTTISDLHSITVTASRTSDTTT